MSLFFLFLSVLIFVCEIIYFFKNSRTGRLTYCIAVTSGLEILAIGTLYIWLISIGQSSFSPSFLVSILQIFSLDAEYTELEFGLLNAPLWAKYCISFYMLLVYTAAPILGGAVIYDVLAGISPHLRLYVNRYRRLYVFSELNERTLTLAIDIKKYESTKTASQKGKCALVFTNVSSSTSSEQFSEYVNQAKNEGAICIRDDILNCTGFRKSPDCRFIIANEIVGEGFDESSNLATLAGILNLSQGFEIFNENGLKSLVWNPKMGCHIYIYSNDDITIESISSIMEQFNVQFKDATKKVELSVARDDARMAEYLLLDHPLYNATEKNRKALRVVIFGKTSFSREIFKAIFWCGQMLDTSLYITVIYKPEEENNMERSEYERYLDRLSPEIIESCTQPTSDYAPECLRLFGSPDDVFRKENYSLPYAGLYFIETDISSIDLHKLMSFNCDEKIACSDIHSFGGYGVDNPHPLYDCDYFFVMNGSDYENMEIASELRRVLVHQQFKNGQGERPNQRIAVSIQNDEVASIANKHFDNNNSIKEIKSDFDLAAPIIFTFGSMSERYKWNLLNLNDKAVIQYKKDPAKYQKEHADKMRIGVDYLQRKKIYDEWSVESRSVHEQYKVFSGLEYMLANERDVFIQRVSWLEHRRWNAFIRTQGFSAPFDTIQTVKAILKREETNQGTQKIPNIFKTKSVINKWHNCLVEASEDRMLIDPLNDDDLKIIDPLDCICRISERDVKKYDIEEAERAYNNNIRYRKKTGQVEAFQLGCGAEKEMELLEAGIIKKASGKEYEVYSREVVNDPGQACKKGDYIKIDSAGKPYPVKKDVFERTHELAEDGTWIQKKTEPVRVWYDGLFPMDQSEELKHLLDTSKLCIDESSEEKYYSYKSETWKTVLSGAKDAVILIREVKRISEDEIEDVKIDIIERSEFEKTYERVDPLELFKTQ